MKKASLNFIGILIAILLIPSISDAGNVQRAGQAGANELLINPWARSSGMASSNAASVKGLEGVYLNVAGTAFTKRTELIFVRTEWLSGSGIAINNFGLSQKAGETSVITLAVTAMSFGQMEITTAELPEGGIGKFSPSYTVISLAYAKEFSNSIYGGLTMKIVNESTASLSASGVALDAGIQYVTGLGKDKLGNKKRDNLKFGISMKNVGPTMKYTGDGKSNRVTLPSGVELTVDQRAADFELPSLIKIGVAYDINLIQKIDSATNTINVGHKLSFMGTFTSNSFTQDQFQLGLEYNIKNLVLLRGGYSYEKDITNSELRTNAMTGPAAGISVQIPLNKEKGSYFSLDYGYQFTENFSGCHSIGAKISL